MKVQPIGGRLVPDPDNGGLLPKEGRVVIPSAYWYRRIAEGAVRWMDQYPDPEPTPEASLSPETVKAIADQEAAAAKEAAKEAKAAEQEAATAEETPTETATSGTASADTATADTSTKSGSQK